MSGSLGTSDRACGAPTATGARAQSRYVGSTPGSQASVAAMLAGAGHALKAALLGLRLTGLGAAVELPRSAPQERQDWIRSSFSLAKSADASCRCFTRANAL